MTDYVKMENPNTGEGMWPGKTIKPRERGYTCEAQGAPRPSNIQYACNRTQAALQVGAEAIENEIIRAREMGQREGKQDALAGMLMHEHLLKTIDVLNSRIARQAETIKNYRVRLENIETLAELTVDEATV